LKRLSEWNGGNRAYGKNFGGGFVGGSDISAYSGQIDPHPFKSTKLTHGDTLISQRTGLSSSSYKGDYYEDENYEDDDELSIILKEFIDRNIKKINEKKKKFDDDDLNEYEDYAAKINALDRKLSSQREKQINKLNQQVNEFSGAAAIGGGPATPLGTNAYGKRETNKERKKRQKFNRTKSFPYK